MAPVVSNEERRRRLTRVVKDLGSGSPVFGTEISGQERKKSQEIRIGRNSNIISGALSKPTLGELAKQKPVFYENKEGEENKVFFEPEFSDLITASDLAPLFANPTDYIENKLLPISRGSHADKELPAGQSIAELVDEPYDVSKVKILDANGKRFVVKRVSKSKVNYDLEEFDMAKQALAFGISTPRPVGYLKDKGNVYLLFEYIEDASNLNEFEDLYRKSRGDHQNFQELNKSLIAALNFGPTVKFDMHWLPKDERWNAKKNNYEILDKACTKLHKLLIFVEEALSAENNHSRQFWIDELNQQKNKIIIEDCLRLSESFGDPELSGEKIAIIVFEKIKEWCGVDLRAPEFKGDIKVGPIFDKLVGIINNQLGGVGYHELLEKTSEEIMEFGDEQCEKFTPIVEREHWGASISLPLRRLCERMNTLNKTGQLRHKDLAYRNIMMKVDEKNRPIPDENGDAQFYVIDWEQH